MKITNFAIRHATAVFVLIACIVVGGLMAYTSLPKEAAPDIKIPVVIVSTPYFGVSPADIETLVTRPLEREFKGLRDLDKMTSTSAENVSIITLEFDPEIDVDEALQKIREKVDKAEPDLPDDAEDPEIIEINSSDWPVLVANVSGDMDLVRLKAVAEELEEDIEAVQGVLRVDIAGGVTREIHVELDPQMLRHHGVSLDQVIGAVQAENINLPGGSLEMGQMKYTIRVPGEFDYPDQMGDIVVKSPAGQPVTIDQLGRVEDGFAERETISRLSTWSEGADGQRRLITQPNISVSVVKRSGENIIAIAEKTREIIAQYEQRYASDGLEIVVLNDMSEHIKARVNELENNIISGLLLVLVVLLFFMGGFRNALFVAISIPLSMLLSFLVLQMLGVTLNMVVLFALVLALGMLVDNAIVIVENIYRHASEGKDRVQAAIDGTREVGWAIVASTATTVAAFFPMLFWPGIMGEFMGYMPMTIIIVLLSSLFVALVINPTVCAVFLRVREGVSFQEDEVPDLAIYRLYRRLLVWSLDHRLVVMLVAVMSLVGSILVYARTSPGVEFFPETTPEQFSVQLELPDGTRLAETDALLDRLAAPLAEATGLVDAWIVDTGVKGGSRVGGGQAPHYGQISVDLVPLEEQARHPSTLMEQLRQQFKDVAGASVVIEKQQMGPPTGAPVSVEIHGEDLATLAALAGQARERMRSIPGLIDLQDDIEMSRPEIQVVVDRKAAAVQGVDTRTIARTVRTAMHGTEASVMRDGEDEYDVLVRLLPEHRRTIEDLEQLFVVNRDEVQVPLVDVASIEVGGGSGSIRHRDRERVVTISANNAEGYLPAKLLEQVEARLAELDVPPGYEIRFTGEQEDRQEAASFLGKALLAALFLIALILVTEFNSIVQPLIILCSVLLSLVGVFLSLIVSGEPFGIIMTGIGIISLAGVVVNNAIVMIDYMNKLREEKGMTRREAVVQAGLVRFRPVMLTAVTTILGMVPLVVGVSIDFVNLDVVVGGSSVEMWGPMARVVSAGLAVATVLTLVVVPVLYSLLDTLSESVRRVLGRVFGVALVLSVVAMAAPALAQQAPAKGPAAEPPAQQDVGEPATQDDARHGEAVGEGAAGPVVEPAETAIVQTARQAADEALEVDAKRTLSLAEARGQARRANLDVRLAETQVAVAEAQVRGAYAFVLPKLNASGNYMVNQEEVTVDFSPPGAPPSEIIIQPKTSWNWEVSATLPLSARAYPGIKIAYQNLDLARHQAADVRERVQFAATDLYFALLTTQRVLEIAREQLIAARRFEVATQRRIDAGVARPFELTRARLRVVQNRKQVEQALLNFVEIREALANLLQTEADFTVVAPEGVEEPPPADELKDVAVRERVAIESQRIQDQIAELLVDEVYYRYLPQLSATFQYADTKDTGLNEAAPQWTLIFGAQWTLWDGGEREALIDERQAQLLAAQLQTEQTVDDIQTEIERAWASYRSAVEQVESSQASVELATESFGQLERAWELGAATQLEVLEAQDDLNVARIGLVQDKLRLQLAVLRLRYLAGLDDFDGDAL